VSPLLIGVLACGGLAATSLALPSGLSYDQYSWLAWGRDLAHLSLDTSGTGTSWKPLPALVDALLSPLGAGAADAWLVVARAGALFAVLMVFRLAWRLAPREARLPAGLLAAATLVLTREWLRRMGVGNADGLSTAFGLLAIDCHLDGRRRQAFWLIVAAGLIRVEAWPFAAAYGLWLWFGDRCRRTVAAGGLLIPLLWFGGDLLGSGSLTQAARLARVPVPGSPGTSAHPALAVVAEGAAMLPTPAWAGVVSLLCAGLVWRDRRGVRAGLTLAACAAAWTAVVAVMAEDGYAGLPRYLFMAAALCAVVAGIGAALPLAAVATLARRAHTRRMLGLVAGAAAGAAFAYGALPNVWLLPRQAGGIDQIADLDSSLAEVVRAAGGAGAILRCGTPVTPWYTVTALEWYLHSGPDSVSMSPRRGRGGPGVVVAPVRGGAWELRARSCPVRS
jgi:hypothetical protein